MKSKKKEKFVPLWEKKTDGKSQSETDASETDSADEEEEEEVESVGAVTKGKKRKKIGTNVLRHGGNTEQTIKRKRGRPKKLPHKDADSGITCQKKNPVFNTQISKGNDSIGECTPSLAKRPRGRPRKVPYEELNMDPDLASTPKGPGIKGKDEITSTDPGHKKARLDPTIEGSTHTPKRPRGRPRKHLVVDANTNSEESDVEDSCEVLKRKKQTIGSNHQIKKEEISQISRSEVKSGVEFVSPSREGSVSSRGRKTTRFNFAAMDDGSSRKKQKVQASEVVLVTNSKTPFSSENPVTLKGSVEVSTKPSDSPKKTISTKRASLTVGSGTKLLQKTSCAKNSSPSKTPGSDNKLDIIASPAKIKHPAKEKQQKDDSLVSAHEHAPLCVGTEDGKDGAGGVKMVDDVTSATFVDISHIEDMVDSAEVNVVEGVEATQSHKSYLSCLSDMVVPVCTTCCKLFHCPLCEEYVGRQRWQFRAHFVRKHWHKRFSFPGGLNALKCCLGCISDNTAAHLNASREGHYHCPACTKVCANVSKFQRHIRHHRKQSKLETLPLDSESEELSASEEEEEELTQSTEEGREASVVSLKITVQNDACQKDNKVHDGVEGGKEGQEVTGSHEGGEGLGVGEGQESAEHLAVGLSVEHMGDKMKALFERAELCAMTRFMIKDLSAEHPSYTKNLDIAVLRCTTCCQLYHCPLCDISLPAMSPTNLQSHFIRAHLHKRFRIRDLYVLRCGMACQAASSIEGQSGRHYHCPICSEIFYGSKIFQQHLTKHPKMKAPVIAKPAARVDNMTSYSLWCWRRQIHEDGQLDEAADEDGKVPLDNRKYLEMLNWDSLALASMGNRELSILSRLTSEVLSFEEIIEEARIIASKSKKEPPRFREAMKQTEWDNMLTFMPGTHYTYVDKLSDIEVMRCETCCELYHCPLCPREEAPSIKPNQLRCHLLRIHWNKRFQFTGGVSILRCNRSCPIVHMDERKRLADSDNISYNSHYHCPLCQQIKSTVNKFRQHIRAHVCGTSHEMHVRKTPSLHVAARLKSFMETGRDLPPEEIKMLQDQISDDDDAGEGNGDQGTAAGVSQDQGDGVENYGADMMAEAGEVEEDGKKETAADSLEECGASQGGEEVTGAQGAAAETPAKKLKKGLRSVAAMVDLDTLLPLPVSSAELASYVSEILAVSCTLLEVGDGSSQSLVQGSLEQIQKIGQLMENLETVQYTSAEDLRQMMMTYATPKQQDNSCVDDNDHRTSELLEAATSQEVMDGSFTAKQEDSLLVKQEPDEALGQDFAVVFDEEGNASIQVFSRAVKQDEDEAREVVSGNAEVDRADVATDAQVNRETKHPASNVAVVAAAVASSKRSRGARPKMDQGDANLDRRKKNVNCPLCSKRFRAMWSLLPHFVKVHSEEASEDVAEEESEDLKKVKSYVKEMGKLEESQCPICGKLFKNLQEAKIHFALKTCEKRQPTVIDTDLIINPETNMYQCPMCDDFESNRPARVIDHMARIHAEKTVPCKACDKKFANEKLLKQHMKINHIFKRKMAICDLCGVEIVASYLQKHRQIMHDPSYVKEKTPRDKYVKCKECPYMAPRRCDLLKHVMRKHRDRKFSCDQCSQKFALEDDLKYHIKYIHLKDKESDPSNAMVTCEECGKSLQQRNMDLHIRRVHRRQRDHVCDQCDKPFSSKYSLHIHKMSIHTRPEDRKYKFMCSYCPAGFFNKRIYMDHLNTHTGHRPYKCEICDKGFKQVNIYRNHMLTHDPKRHTCQTCNAVFNSKLELSSHMREHPLWKCVCTQRFPTAKTLLEHQALCNILKSKQTQGQVSLLASRSQAAAPVGEPNFVVIQPDGTACAGEENTVLVLQTDDGATTDSTAMAVTQIVDNLQELTAPSSSQNSRENVMHLWDLANAAKEVQGDVKTSGESMVVQFNNGTSQLVSSSLVSTMEGQGGHEIVVTEAGEGGGVEIVGESGEVVMLNGAMSGLLKQGGDGAIEGGGEIGMDGGLMEIDGENQFLCGYCQEAFTTMDTVQQHMMTDHVELLLSPGEPLQQGSVTGEPLQQGSVTGESLQQGSVTGEPLQQGSVTGESLQQGSVTGESLQQGSVTGEPLQQGSVTGEPLQQ